MLLKQSTVIVCSSILVGRMRGEYDRHFYFTVVFLIIKISVVTLRAYTRLLLSPALR